MRRPNRPYGRAAPEYVAIWGRLQLCGGVLPFIEEGKASRAVIPEPMVPVVLQSLHNSETGGHLGYREADG